MSVVLGRDDGVHILICKGAVEEVFAVCRRYPIGDETGLLDESHFASAKETTAKLNADGFRVIAVATKEMPPTQATYSVADEADLTLLGYIAFLDPPKETCAPAIAALQAGGVQVKILTGDNDIVTRKICHDVGLSVDRIVLGSEMTALSPLANLAETATVFAKVSPSQKAAIIEALHRNDGPALKTADVGISVDSAVDIAKESADIILLEKSLAVLGDGVVEGRKVFGNITKYIKMGELRFWQHVQRARGQHRPAVSADDGDSGAYQQPALRCFADHDPNRHRRSRICGGAAAMGHWQHHEVRAVHWLNQLDLRLRHLFHDALRLQCVE